MGELKPYVPGNPAVPMGILLYGLDVYGNSKVTSIVSYCC